MKYPKDFINKIICGDCIKIMKYMPDKCVDFVFADPPYGVNKRNVHWDKEYPCGFEKEILRISKKGVIITCGERNIIKCISGLGKEYRSPFYAWNKNGMTRSSIGFQNIMIAIAGGKVRLGQNFIKFIIKDLSVRGHPSVKPIEYMREVVKRFTKENEIIFDPFLGSGTTAVSAKELNRNFIGVEINKEYCEIAKQRLNNVNIIFNGLKRWIK